MTKSKFHNTLGRIDSKTYYNFISILAIIFICLTFFGCESPRIENSEKVRKFREPPTPPLPDPPEIPDPPELETAKKAYETAQKAGQAAKEAIETTRAAKQAAQKAQQEAQQAQQSAQQAERSVQQAQESIQQVQQAVQGTHQSIQQALQSPQHTQQSANQAQQSIRWARQSAQQVEQLIDQAQQSINQSQQAIQDSQRLTQDSQRYAQDSQNSAQTTLQLAQHARQFAQDALGFVAPEKNSTEQVNQLTQDALQSAQQAEENANRVQESDFDIQLAVQQAKHSSKLAQESVQQAQQTVQQAQNLTGQAQQLVQTATQDIKILSVPKLVGLSLESAEMKLQSYRMEAIVQRVRTKPQDGTVCQQHPKAGKKRKNDTPVDLEVAYRQRPERQERPVPDVTNMSLEDAKKKLLKKGFCWKVERYISRTDENPDTVWEQKPRHSSNRKKDTPVELTVTYQEKRPKRTKNVVPPLKGKSLAEAKEELRNKNLTWRVKAVIAKPKSNEVLKQYPKAGALRPYNNQVELEVEE